MTLWSRDLAAVRYTGSGQGHYESFYVKANHPDRRLGLWLKFNLLEPTHRAENLEGELRGVWFDGETGRHVVVTEIIPRPLVVAHQGEPHIQLGNAVLEWHGDTLTERASVSDGGHRMAWDVRLAPQAPPAILYPSRWMYDRGFPKKKLVTPIPQGRLEGWVEVDGTRHEVDGWEGLHGHNWGREHAFRYAYGNGIFPDGVYVEGFSARLKMGPVVTPFLSLMLVRLPGDRTLLFNEPARWLSGRPKVDDLRWDISIPGSSGTRVRLMMSADASDAVGLRYRYPDGRTGFCINTKFARGKLRVEEHGRILYEAVSEKCELETFRPRESNTIIYS